MNTIKKDCSCFRKNHAGSDSCIIKALLCLVIALTAFGGLTGCDWFLDNGNNNDLPSGLTAEEIAAFSSTCASAVASAVIDNGSDMTDPSHVIMKLRNTDGSVKIEYEYWTVESVPVSGEGTYIFNNYIDTGGVSMNGVLDYYIIYGASPDKYDYVFSGSIVYNGAISLTVEYDYMLSADGSSVIYNGYVRVDGSYYYYNGNGTLSSVPLQTPPAFNPPDALSPPTPDEDPVVLVTGVTLDRITAALTVGGTITLAATVAPADADDNGVTWYSNDTAVAAVPSDTAHLAISVTAVSPGEATITVTTNDGSYAASCVVTVTGAAPEPSGDVRVNIN